MQSDGNTKAQASGADWGFLSAFVGLLVGALSCFLAVVVVAHAHGHVARYVMAAGLAIAGISVFPPVTFALRTRSPQLRHTAAPPGIFVFINMAAVVIAGVIEPAGATRAPPPPAASGQRDASPGSTSPGPAPPPTAASSGGAPDASSSPGAEAELIQRVEAKEQVKSVLRDPESAQFAEVTAHGRPGGYYFYCGLVNAKNGFGGYNGSTPFVVIPQVGALVNDGTARFRKTFKEICLDARDSTLVDF